MARAAMLDRVPFTFLAHQAPLLPLKVWRPRWFDGTALVIGSMVPDFALGASDRSWFAGTHAPWVQLWFSTPVAVVLALLVKGLVAPVLAPHLPDLPPYHLRAYAALGRWPGNGPRGEAALVLISSGFLGAWSHLALDSFTHAHGWVVEQVAPLRSELFRWPLGGGGRAVHGYDLLQIAITAFGVVAAVVCLRSWGPQQALAADGAEGLRPTGASTVLLRRGTITATIVAVAGTLATLGAGNLKAMVLRPFGIAFVGLAITCLVARRAMRPGVPAASGPADTSLGTTGDGATDRE